MLNTSISRGVVSVGLDGASVYISEEVMNKQQKMLCRGGAKGLPVASEE